MPLNETQQGVSDSLQRGEAHGEVQLMEIVKADGTPGYGLFRRNAMGNNEPASGFIPERDAVSEATARGIPKALAAFTLFPNLAVGAGVLGAGIGLWGGRKSAEMVIGDSPETGTDTSGTLPQNAPADIQEDIDRNKQLHWRDNGQEENFNSLKDMGLNLDAEDVSLGGAIKGTEEMWQGLTGLKLGTTGHFTNAEAQGIGATEAAAELAGGPIRFLPKGLAIAGAAAGGVAATFTDTEGKDNQQIIENSRDNAAITNVLTGIGFAGAGKLASRQGKNLANKVKNTLNSKHPGGVEENILARSRQGTRIRGLAEKHEVPIQEVASEGGAGGRAVRELIKINEPAARPHLEKVHEASENSREKIGEIAGDEGELHSTSRKVTEGVKDAVTSEAKVLRDFTRDYQKSYRAAKGPFIKEYAKARKDLEGYPANDFKVEDLFEGARENKPPEFLLKYMRKLINNKKEAGVLHLGDMFDISKEIRNRARSLKGDNQLNLQREMYNASEAVTKFIYKNAPDINLKGIDKRYKEQIVRRFRAKGTEQEKLFKAIQNDSGGDYTHAVNKMVFGTGRGRGGINTKGYSNLRQTLGEEAKIKFDNEVFLGINDQLQRMKGTHPKKIASWMRANQDFLEEAPDAMLNKLFDPKTGSFSKAITETISSLNIDDLNKLDLREITDLGEDTKHLVSAIKKTMGDDGLKLLQAKAILDIKNTGNLKSLLTPKRISSIKEIFKNNSKAGENLIELAEISRQFDAFIGAAGGGRGKDLATGGKNIASKFISTFKRSTGIDLTSLASSVRQAVLKIQSFTVSGATHGVKIIETRAMHKVLNDLFTMSGSSKNTAEISKLLGGKAASPEFMRKLLARIEGPVLNNVPLMRKVVQSGLANPEGGGLHGNRKTTAEEEASDMDLRKAQAGIGSRRHSQNTDY